MIPDSASDEFRKFLDGYLDCMMWSVTVDDIGGEPMEVDSLGERSVSHLTARLREDVRVVVEPMMFFVQNYGDLAELIRSGKCAGWDYHGHDFMLTRDGHGAGFWDRGYGDVGDRLTEAAEGFGALSCEFWVEFGHPSNSYAFTRVGYGVSYRASSV